MPRQPRRAPEHNLQAKVLRYLVENAAPDVFGFAIPNAGRRTYRAAAALKAEGMMPGVADTCIKLPQGRAGWLELKTPTGALGDAQKGFAARCDRLGHSYAVARTLEQAIDMLARWGALR